MGLFINYKIIPSVILVCWELVASRAAKVKLDFLICSHDKKQIAANIE